MARQREREEKGEGPRAKAQRNQDAPGRGNHTEDPQPRRTSALSTHQRGRCGQSMSRAEAPGRTLGSRRGRGGGVILHYDGQAWTRMESGTSATLDCVHGTGPADVFAAGEDGAVVHYDGKAWRSLASGTSQLLMGLWAASPRDVFAVGMGGTILRYDGTAWRPMASRTTEHFAAFWGRSGHEVFAAGSSGTILRYDGTAWRPVESGNVPRRHLPLPGRPRRRRKGVPEAAGSPGGPPPPEVPVPDGLALHAAGQADRGPRADGAGNPGVGDARREVDRARHALLAGRHPAAVRGPGAGAPRVRPRSGRGPRRRTTSAARRRCCRRGAWSTSA